MQILSPHRANTREYPEIQVQVVSGPKSIDIKLEVKLEALHTSHDFSQVGYDNNGLWDYDVAEVFLQRGDGHTNYLELQVSPLDQKFALIIKRPRIETEHVSKLGSKLHGQYSNNVFSASFSVYATDIPGKGSEIYGNIFCCLGPKDDRHYFGLNINPEVVPDYHRPELFKPLGHINE